MSSYCHECNKKSVEVSKENQEVIDDWLYSHDECPKCGKVFYSPAVPRWKNEMGGDQMKHIILVFLYPIIKFIDLIKYIAFSIQEMALNEKGSDQMEFFLGFLAGIGSVIATGILYFILALLILMLDEEGID